MSTVKNYLSLIKFSHTIFAMPFALIGFFLGLFTNERGLPAWVLDRNNEQKTFLPNSYNEFYFNGISFHTWSNILTLILVILCMIFTRSAAMAFNRYLD